MRLHIILSSIIIFSVIFFSSSGQTIISGKRISLREEQNFIRHHLFTVSTPADQLRCFSFTALPAISLKDRIEYSSHTNDQPQMMKYLQ